ncbi:MAG: phosphatidate cytidylyltransferase [Erysipelotrichia bacterium]|jgi:phosphatidate cytidylyltransferase|nr:phosphatidate cytidylyltransferase [Erysipelotrichia bacterium]
MKQRIITALGLLIVLVPALLLGGIFFKIIASFFVVVGCYEILRLFSDKWPKWTIYSIYIIFILGLITAFNFEYFIQLNCIVLIFLFLILVLYQEVSFEYIGLIFLVFNIIILTIASIDMMYSINKMLLIYTCLATYITDTFAFFVGKAFGKHKLNPRISPNKTIEGTLGGYIFGAIISFLFGYFFIKEINLTFLISGSLIMPALGQIGDLSFSAIKRHFNIKDFGNLFPGHGGVLDRVDSLTFNCLVMFCLMSNLL